MNKNEYIELHRLLAKLNYEIAITLCETTNPELIKEYQEYQEAILKIMQIMIIDGGNK
jgi:hypothetical protein